jgi:hypothetical protein
MTRRTSRAEDPYPTCHAQAARRFRGPSSSHKDVRARFARFNSAPDRIESEVVLNLMPQVFAEAGPGVVAGRPGQERPMRQSYSSGGKSICSS